MRQRVPSRNHSVTSSAPARRAQARKCATSADHPLSLVHAADVTKRMFPHQVFFRKPGYVCSATICAAAGSMTRGLESQSQSCGQTTRLSVECACAARMSGAMTVGDEGEGSSGRGGPRQAGRGWEGEGGEGSNLVDIDGWLHFQMRGFQVWAWSRTCMRSAGTYMFACVFVCCVSLSQGFVLDNAAFGVEPSFRRR